MPIPVHLCTRYMYAAPTCTGRTWFHARARGRETRWLIGTGERPEYGEGDYAAFVLDQAGHNIELVNHNRT